MALPSSGTMQMVVAAPLGSQPRRNKYVSKVQQVKSTQPPVLPWRTEEASVLPALLPSPPMEATPTEYFLIPSPPTEAHSSELFLPSPPTEVPPVEVFLTFQQSETASVSRGGEKRVSHGTERGPLSKWQNEKWEQGIVLSIGDKPTIKPVDGSEPLRFAYRTIHWAGKEKKRMIRVGDRLDFVRSSRVDKALFVRLTDDFDAPMVGTPALMQQVQRAGTSGASRATRSPVLPYGVPPPAEGAPNAASSYVTMPHTPCESALSVEEMPMPSSPGSSCSSIQLPSPSSSHPDGWTSHNPYPDQAVLLPTAEQSPQRDASYAAADDMCPEAASCYAYSTL